MLHIKPTNRGADTNLSQFWILYTSVHHTINKLFCLSACLCKWVCCVLLIHCKLSLLVCVYDKNEKLIINIYFKLNPKKCMYFYSFLWWLNEPLSSSFLFLAIREIPLGGLGDIFGLFKWALDCLLGASGDLWSECSQDSSELWVEKN